MGREIGSLRGPGHDRTLPGLQGMGHRSAIATFPDACPSHQVPELKPPIAAHRNNAVIGAAGRRCM